MRKDVILGMTIGGGMLAVVIGYLTLSSSPKRDKHGVEVGGVADVEPGGAGDTAGQSADAGNAPDPKAGAGKPTLLLQPAPPSEKADPVWGPRLWAGATVSVTPGPTDAQTPVGPVAGDAPPKGESPSASAIDTAGQAARPAPPITTNDVTPPTALPAGGVQPPAAAATRTHKIQKGETFSTIAATVYGSPNLYGIIVQANPKVDPTRLKPGTEINLPDIATVKATDKSAEKSSPAGTAAAKTEATLDPKTQYRVQSGDSLHKIAVKIYGKIGMVDKIYELNKAAIGDNPAKLKLGMVLKLPPAQ